MLNSTIIGTKYNSYLSINQGFFFCGYFMGRSFHLIGSNFPYFAKRVGNINKLRIVELNNPPTIIEAIGPSISRPGSPLPNISGSNPSAVTMAVIRIDGNRWEAPKAAVEKFHGKFSFFTKC